MPVQVIRGDVQDNGYRRVKLIGCFKLEAGDLKHGPGFVRTFVNEGHDRHADIATHQGGQAGLLQNLTRQRCGGGLAV